MGRMALGLLLAALLIDTKFVVAQDGRLDKIRDEVRPKESQSSGSENKKRPSQDDDSILDETLGPILGYTILLPFMGPHAALADEWDRKLSFVRFPYQSAYPGYLIEYPAASLDAAEKWDKVIQPKSWVLQVSLEEGNDFSGLNRLGGRILLDTSSRLGIMATWNYFRESLRCGCTDELVLSDYNATFRFAQSEWGMFRAGLGVRVLNDRGGTDLGFNFHYGGDFFPVNPLVVSGALDVGNLGAAGVIHVRATVGATHHGWEIFAGYDFLRIGTVNLQGPVIGVRCCF